MPILPVLVGAGILLGLGNLLTASDLFGVQSLTSRFPQLDGLTDMIHLVANTAFTYIPVLVAWSATKRFGGNPVLGITLGLVLCNETLLSGAKVSSILAGTVKPTYWRIFGLRVMQVGYQNSVLAPLLAALLMVQIEKFLKKHLPAVLQTILVAPIAIFIAAFFTFLVIGPIANQISTWIAEPLINLFKTQPIIAGLLFGLLWEPLVVSGLHYALIAVNLQLIASNQQSQMIAIIATICMAEVGADLAVARLERNNNRRGVALSAAVSSLLGITEPSIFGVTIPHRYPFLCVMGSAGLAGILVALSQEYAVSAGPAGPLSLVIIPVQFWKIHSLILLISFLAGFISTFVTGTIITQRAAQIARPAELD
ncbi:PTS transporter subunit EIIC [Lapidilactobacillus gannanensis]|uniref:PTS transporter subunit EIIC n=1 Tax=Lapidilactobacillus gannanensis TaxID=2486002 RepID=A0ABW4BL05_9LACO|nr:PTS transporter subunit EIIC [Lapidilactobacillus gannanensis]